jgi:hypothetical protein
MPVGQNTNKDITYCLLLGFFLGIAYLPLSSFLFAVKNDALIANFPPKYFFSAALHAGHWPLWNPYMNFGLPMYADPGFAFWHPLTFLFGALGYNIWLLSVEILVYLWLGGIFMYFLGRYLGHSRKTAFLIAAMFMCCGFFIGNLSQTNFLTCAAFLPLVVQTFLQLQQTPTPKRMFFAAGSIYLLISGGHPAIPIGTLYFLAALLAGLALTKPKPRELKKLATTNLLLILTVLGLTAPIWLSWLQIWPYFTRASPVVQSNSADTGFTLTSWSSFVFPFATMANTDFFGTTTSMRSGYFSFIGFGLLLFTLAHKRNRLQHIFLIEGVLFLLVSFGGDVKIFIYSHMPLLTFIRDNGEYRIFTLFAFILTVSWPLERLLQQSDKAINHYFPRMINAFFLLSLIALLIGCGIMLYRQIPFLPPSTNGLLLRIKHQLDILSPAEALTINAAILLLLTAAWFLLRHRVRNAILIPGIISIDLILSCWLLLPFTGVQRQSPADMQALLPHVSPGIPLPTLEPLAQNDRPGLEKILGRWSYYTKQPGTPVKGDYPVLLQETKDYFESPCAKTLVQRPFVFRTAPNAPLPRLTAFSPTRIELQVGQVAAPAKRDHENGPADTLVLLQNHFPGWQSSIDGRPCPLLKLYGSFMGVAVPADNFPHRVQFLFSPPGLLWYLLIPVITLLLLAFAGTRQPLAQSDHGPLNQKKAQEGQPD